MMDARPIVGLEDIFGAQARGLRTLQRRLAELFEAASYEEVIPPLMERPSVLNAGAGRFLADQTLVLSDPADAGLLAIRPDITPQIARIAATRLISCPQLRLYYSGPVILARPEWHGGSRQQWQTGIECLGVPGEEGDAEVLRLAAKAMLTAGFAEPILQLGHIGLLKALVRGAKRPLDAWTELLRRRSPEDLRAAVCVEPSLGEDVRRALIAMASGMADCAWVAAGIGAFNARFDAAAQELLALAERMESELGSEVRIYVDAGVMPRFLYHSGILFVGFAAGAPQALLYGGRYDAMMAAHGRDMPATGFSCDLWAWLNVLQRH